MQRTLWPVVNRLLAEVPDRDLLERYLLDRDQEAFAQLVSRYNRLVWGQCRNLLANDADADDAFQATFLTLARSAKKLRAGAPLGPWLHGVAFRVCMNARRVIGRRAKREQASARSDAQQPVADSSWEKAFAAVAAEVQQLPETQRVAFVLCYLEGRPAADAAAGLGLKLGTFTARLTRAKQALLERLAKRGLGVGVLALGGVTGSAVVAPAALVDRTLALLPSGVTIPGSVQVLTHGVTGMTMTPFKLLAACLLVATGLGLGLSLPSNAAPVPKVDNEKDEGLIWTYHYKTGELAAYSSTGAKKKTLPLKDGRQLLGFTPDGKKIVFVGKEGELADPRDQEGLTVHWRDINDSTKGHDTGIEYKRGDHYHWSSDSKRVVRVQHLKPVLQMGAQQAIPLPKFTNTLYEVDTKKAMLLDLPDDPQQVLGWSPDDQWLLTSKYTRGTVTQYRHDYFEYDLKLKTTRAICDALQLHNCVVSPDGRALFGVGCKHDDNQTPRRYAMVRVDIATGRATEVAHHENQSFASCRWSPNGKRLAYIWYDPTSKEQVRLIIRDADGRNDKSIKIETPEDSSNEMTILGWFLSSSSPDQAAPKPAPAVGKAPASPRG